MLQAHVKPLFDAKLQVALSLQTVAACEEVVALLLRHSKHSRKDVVRSLCRKYPVFNCLPTTKGGI